MIGEQKSEPDIYQPVQKLTQVNAQQMVHIGDYLMQDTSCVKSADVYAIWLNRLE